jgi:CTP synthase
MGSDCLVVHLTLVPYLAAAGELKTKPTQHSVKMLLEQGVQPDIIVCRTEHHLNDNIRDKIARFCNVLPSSVVESIDAKSIYDVPVLMRNEMLDSEVLKLTQTPVTKEANIEEWEEFLFKLKNPIETIQIALVGKYVELQDAYKSILESFVHAGAQNQAKIVVNMVHSEQINDQNVADMLGKYKGILVAPGFGERGIEGKIVAVRFARENKIPFLGICLGMQCAVIEFARNVLNLKDAHSTEFRPNTPFPVIDIMENQKKISGLGGTMRLGAYPCEILKDTLAYDAYGKEQITERHRHRYEFNNDYLSRFTEAGMVPTGINTKDDLIEIVEVKDHPYFVGVQFHPEYKSTVATPHPVFMSFVRAIKKYQ